MRIIVSGLALALISVAAPAASACRIGPTPIAMAVWEQAPTPDQLLPGEVALEVVIPTHARLSQRLEPDEIIITTCNPDQRTLLQVVRVLSGEAHSAEFVVVPGWAIMTVVPIDPATGKPITPVEPQRFYVVGRLNAQGKYVVVGDDPATGTAGRALPALDTRWPQ